VLISIHAAPGLQIGQRLCLPSISAKTDILFLSHGFLFAELRRKPLFDMGHYSMGSARG
jgi:hypothetical protein